MFLWPVDCYLVSLVSDFTQYCNKFHQHMKHIYYAIIVEVFQDC